MPSWVPTAPGLLVPDHLKEDSRWNLTESGFWFPGAIAVGPPKFVGSIPKREELKVTVLPADEKKEPIGWFCHEVIGIGVFCSNLTEKKLADQELPPEAPKLGFDWYYSD